MPTALPLLTFSFPWRTINGSLPAQVTEEESIRESVTNLLSTARQSRLMRSALGTNALRYVFANETPLIEETLRFEASRVLSQYEPRIVLIAVNILPRTKDDPGIKIEVQYQIRATQQVDTAPILLAE